MSRDAFVQALGIVFCLIMVALGLFMTQNKLMPAETAILSAAALIPTALGMLIGQRARHLMSEQIFRKALFISLCVAGFYMVARAFL